MIEGIATQDWLSVLSNALRSNKTARESPSPVLGLSGMSFQMLYYPSPFFQSVLSKVGRLPRRQPKCVA